MRTPLKIATKTLGWTQANVAVKKMADWMPHQSLKTTVNAMGGMLPDKDQETVLPEVAHNWVRSWIQAVEFSADRAGLLASGSPAAACSALLRLSAGYAAQVHEAHQNGAGWLLRERAAVERATSERLRELLRFAVSEPYLVFLLESSNQAK
jgi:Zn-dependent protease with chaperone function